MNLFDEIEKNLIVLKPVLNPDGKVDFWSASYRYVHKITGQNMDRINIGEEFVTFSPGNTPEEAVLKLLEYKRDKPSF